MHSMHEVNKMLLEYSVKLGLNSSMSLQQLISSHNYLREELNHGQRKEWKDEIETARAFAAQQQLDWTWIKIEDLRKMTVLELANFLCEDE